MRITAFFKNRRAESDAARVLDSCPLDALADPIALGELVRLNGDVYAVVAMSHRGRVAIRALGASGGTGARWVPSRYVVRVE